MSGEESDVATFDDSDYTSGSDNDLPGSSSSPERVPSSKVPVLALGGPAVAQHRRPAVPLLGLNLTAVQQSSPSQQATSQQSYGTPPLQADPIPAQSEAESAAGTSQQLAEVSERHDRAQPLSRAGSHRRPGQQPVFNVQIASEAFIISGEALSKPEYRHLSQSEAVKQFCSARLGLRLDALKFYELREVQTMAECSECCTQLAVAVEGSGM